MELLIILTGLITAVAISALSKRRGIIELASLAASFVALVSAIIIAFKVSSSGTWSFLSVFSVDALGAIVMLIIGFIGFAVNIYSVYYLRQEIAKSIIGFNRVKQYFALLNLFLTTMFLAISSNSPIFSWISIEATTLATAFLISFYNKPSSIEAAWKYLIINSIGLLLGFFGTLLYFTSVSFLGGEGFVSWQMLLDNVSHLDPMIAKIAFVFVLIGYGTKVGLSPMHTWLPDAHSKAPAPISALLSGVLLNVALVVVLRFKVITDAAIGSTFSQNLMIAFGLLSIFIAALIVFNQRHYKRLLAYSSVENMGIMAMGFGFGGLGAFAAIFHMIYHALIKSALFLTSGTIFLRYSSTKIENIRGALIALPMTGILFFAGFLAITGVPPFGIFTTKLLILSEGIRINPIVTIIALFSMTILFIGFLKSAVAMVFGEKPEGIESGKENIWLVIPPLALITVTLFLSFYVPPFLYKLINDVALHY